MTPEEITAIFATAAAAFQPIVGQPSDDDLTALRDILYPLLLDIPYTEYAVNDPLLTAHNLVGLIEPVATYTARWGEAFPTPTRPPPYPAIPDDATAVVRARREAEHALRVADFASYEAAERAVAKFIRDAVDELWYRDLRHPRSYYTTVTANDLLAHLDANCGGLHPSELVNLPTEMMGYYMDAEGIPEYIIMLEDAQRKLARANLPMSDDQLLAIASTAVLASEHFPHPTDEWEALPRDQKTWTAWKTHYRAAHLARKRLLLASGRSNTTGGVAHAVTYDTTIQPETLDRLDGYLDNLAAAATNDRTTLSQLIDSNANLTANVATLTSSLAALAAAYTILAAGSPAPANAAPPAARPSAPNRNRNLAPNGYCWTHGYRVGIGHNSLSCSNKAAGHKDTATRADIMGGSTANKNWERNNT